MSMSDALAVPPDVRTALCDITPLDSFTLYDLGHANAVAVTNQDDKPYELYISYASLEHAAGQATRVLRHLVDTRHTTHSSLSGLLPPDADKSLPLCRDVWCVDSGRHVSVDVSWPPGGAQTSFPFRANLLAFAASDVGRGDFTKPVQFRTGHVTFVKGADADQAV